MTIAAVLGIKGGDVVTADAGQKVSEVLSILAGRRIGAVPVLRDGEVVGVFSERDVLYGLDATGAVILDAAIGDVMTSPPITVTPDVGVLSALSLMTKRRVRHLPVLDGGRLVGLVSIGDLVKFRMDRIEADVEAMRSYIQSA